MQLRDLQFRDVAPLLESSEPRAGRLVCTFRCPATGKQVVSTVTPGADASGVAGRAATRARTGALHAAVRELRRTLARQLGRGALARLATDVAVDAAATAGERMTLTRKAREEAVVAAFRQVRGQFRWDEAASAYRLVEQRPATAGVQAVAVVAALLLGSDALAQERVVITVGGDRDAGKAHASEHGGSWAKSPSKAFKLASNALAAGGDLDVVVRLAAGDYEGDLGSGAYTLPSLRNPAATLTIEGGWSPDFTDRDPFGTPTRFVTNSGRSQPMLRFYNSRPADQDELEALVLDGLHFDAAGSNSYDAETNTLLKRGSCTHVMIHFGYLRTELLDVRHCAFLNSAHRVFETTIRCASDEAEVRLTNNLFLNDVVPVKLDTARYRHKAARIVVERNSFLLNWAYNPDPNSSNPAALELGSADAADEVVLRGNLFYANFGGAVLAAPSRLPALVFEGNNFVGNGLLHGLAADEAAAVVAAVNGRYLPLDVDTVEELDAVEVYEGNVALAPGLPLALGEVGVVDAGAIEVESSWENEVRRMLGQNVDGGTVAVSDYAPLKSYDPQRPPVPTVAEARAYGFSPELARDASR